MKKHINIIIAVSFIFTLTSCATIFTGSKTKVVINSNIPAADQVTIDNKTETNVMFPYRTTIKNGYKESTISAQKEGYDPVTIGVEKKLNGIFFANLLLSYGAIPGMLVDAATGSIKKVSNKDYYLMFTPEKQQPTQNTTIINAETKSDSKQVVGDGNTALESTIIRWYIVSAPAGADVQWRVISSTPDVKNTNQSFLGSTPYESTESFDIMGLTYNNSGNIQIEISCEKPGYITQSKRFNVRQAIDQKEISTKFNLIKED